MSEISTVTELLATIEPVVRGWIQEQIGDNAASNDPGDQFEFEFSGLADGDTLYYDGAAFEWKNTATLRNLPASSTIEFINPAASEAIFNIKSYEASGGIMGGLHFYGRDDAANEEEYARILAGVQTEYSGVEDGEIYWHLKSNGAFPVLEQMWLVNAGVNETRLYLRSDVNTNAADVVQLRFVGRNEIPTSQRYATITAYIVDRTNATAEGGLAFGVVDNGSSVDQMKLTSNTLTFPTAFTLTTGAGDLTLNAAVVSVVGPADGGLTNYDLKVGDTTTPDYGMIQIGNASIGRTSYNVGSVNLDGTVIIRNLSGPVTGLIEFIFTESAGGATRFALPKSGVGNATYNPRSMLIAGPAPSDTAMVTVAYWQTQGIFDNLVCDTGGDGADLGVQNDLEVEGDIFVDSIKESTTAAGTTFANAVIHDGQVIIDINAAEALIVRADGDAGDVLIANTNTGRVGIGTTPSRQLHIASAAATAIFIQSTGVDKDPQFRITNDARTWLVLVNGSVLNDSFLIYDNTAAATRLQIDTSGDAIFGGTGPLAQLHVDQPSTTAAQPVMFLDQGDVSEQIIKASYSGADVDMTIIELDVTGAPKFGWSETPNVFTLSEGLAIADNNELRLHDNGNYVGFEAPALSADQIWVLPTADGVEGSVLSTDGSGTLQWDSNASEKSWAFMSRDANSGANYIGGYYKFETSDNDFNPAVTFGTANASYAAHFFLVQAAGGAGGTDTVIRVTGTTIDDQGNRTAAVDVDITVDDAGAAGTYYETTEKWIGQVTVEKQSGPDLLCNYGFCKYWDNSNSDFKVTGFEATWLGAKNDATPNIIIRHHKATGWTYNNGAAPTPPSAIADMVTDHNTEIQIRVDEEGAWKRDNLSTVINGSSGEGTLIELLTSTNRTYAIGNFILRIVPQ